MLDRGKSIPIMMKIQNEHDLSSKSWVISKFSEKYMFQILKNYITQVWIFSKTYIQMWNKVCAEKCNYHWSKGIGCSRSKNIKITKHVQIVNRFTGSYKLSIVVKNRLIHPIREFSSYLILCTVHRHRPQESRWWMGWWHSGTQAS